MPILRKLVLTDTQLGELMTSSWNRHIATIGPGTRPDLTLDDFRLKGLRRNS